MTDCRVRVLDGELTHRVVVLLELLQLFEEGRHYSEKEVGELLRTAHEDVAWLRPELVNYRYLQREAGVYWVNPEPLIRDATERQEVPLEEAMRRRPS
ncbi:MAG: DUF2087 domain-containing protein [Propionibacteriaceae bacterium]|nr:DUF2087 domain-containing protein [Propionibacteriaceae bacterium]